MLEPNLAAQFENKSYQAVLGDSLLATMDREDAIDFCISNEWVGVLDRLLKSDRY